MNVRINVMMMIPRGHGGRRHRAPPAREDAEVGGEAPVPALPVEHDLLAHQPGHVHPNRRPQARARHPEEGAGEE